MTRSALAAAAVIALASAAAAVASHRAGGAATRASASGDAGAPSAAGAPAAAAAIEAEAALAGLAAGAPVRLQQQYSLPTSTHSFYFTRAIYSSGRGWGRRGGSWATDYPKADLQFLVVLKRLARIDSYDRENAVALDDPEIRRFPFLYALEVGRMSLTPAEQKGLRDYLLAGGFLIIDDFWGDDEWANFQYEIQRVLPEYTIEELPIDHPIFSAYYQIDEIMQVPNVRNAAWGVTAECRFGPCDPAVLGIHDDHGRLMVLINFNTDLGDAWEWAEQPTYPLKYSTYAFQIAVNFIIYAMSH